MEKRGRKKKGEKIPHKCCVPITFWYRPRHLISAHPGLHRHDPRSSQLPPPPTTLQRTKGGQGIVNTWKNLLSSRKDVFVEKYWTLYTCEGSQQRGFQFQVCFFWFECFENFPSQNIVFRFLVNKHMCFFYNVIVTNFRLALISCVLKDTDDKRNSQNVFLNFTCSAT